MEKIMKLLSIGVERSSGKQQRVAIARALC
jgi:ABC-type polar amino acid transport system ATPase subunit